MQEAPWLVHLLHLPDVLVYLTLFGAALLENVLPPVPGDTVVLFGGYLVGLGRLQLPVTFVMVTLGSWGGFMVYYAVGRWLGHTGAHRWVARWVTPEALQRGEHWVRRYGHWVVLANRMLPGARSVISLGSGFTGMPAPLVGLMALISAALWNVLLVGGGYTIGEHWQRVLALLRVYNGAVLVLLGVGVALLLARWWRRRVRLRTRSPSRQP